MSKTGAMHKNKKARKRFLHNQRIAARAFTSQLRDLHREMVRAELSALNITDLRKRSRGIVKDGYRMKKPDLLAAIVAVECS